MSLLKLVEIHWFKLDADFRVELPDDARIIAVEGGQVVVEIVVNRYDR